MAVFLIEPSMTMQSCEEAKNFFKIIVEQLTMYGIEFYEINQYTISKYKSKISSDSLVVLFNESNTERDDEKVKHLLNKALEEKASIWPIALNRDNRMPEDILAKKQTYDVSEQLRSRNLGVEYLPTIAKLFSRKIISYVLPTIYSESGVIFISHRRVDGEEIAAKLCDRIKVQAQNANIFRDVTQVQVGEEAQSMIDKAMEKSDVFVFIHTQQATKSDWIQKELRYALIRNIPIVWVQIDNASISDLSIMPSEKPHLSYISANFNDEEKLVNIADEILYTAFQATINRNNVVFDFLNTIRNLFNGKVNEYSSNNMIYFISMPRKGYHYPQRNIEQYFQLFGRTPIESDVTNLLDTLQEKDGRYDSAVILTDRVVKSQHNKNVVIDSMDDFYYHWNKYINVERNKKSMEIIISGAFPDGEEIYKQTLTDALIIFAKSILKHGYVLTFGSHPTFQKLFIEVAKEVCPDNYNEMLRMYISKWFEDKYKDKRAYLQSYTQLFETTKSDDLNKSLTIMRKEMIQRKEVVALICLGGKIKENKNEEGIREEIQIATEVGIPVFIVGAVGGCSSEVALEYKKNNWHELGNVPANINENFMQSLDFFNLSQEMLLFLENQHAKEM